MVIVSSVCVSSWIILSPPHLLCTSSQGYFVLWDEQLLQSMLHPKTELGKKALRDLETLSKAKTNSQVNRSPSLDKPYRSDWLSVAQDDMLGVEKLCLAKELVGVLYNLAFESSKRDNGHWDIYDEDAIAFAKAYTDAMVRGVYLIFLSTGTYEI